MCEEATNAVVQYKDGRTEIIELEARGIVELEEIPHEYNTRHNKMVLFLQKWSNFLLTRSYL